MRGESWGVDDGLSVRGAHRGRRHGGCGEGDGADERGPWVSERGGANERVGADRVDPKSRERARGRARRVGWAKWAESLGEGGGWADLGFSFIMNFYSLSFLVFSFEFKSNQTTNSILNISNICIHQKQSLGLA